VGFGVVRTGDGDSARSGRASCCPVTGRTLDHLPRGRHQEPVDSTSTPLRSAKRPAATSPAPAAEVEGESGVSGEPRRGAEAFAPIEYYFVNQRAPAAARTRRSGRLSLRIILDPQFLLAVAIALPVLAVEGTYQLALPWLAVAVPLGYVGLQLLLTAWRTPPDWLAPLRLALALAFIVVA